MQQTNIYGETVAPPDMREGIICDHCDIAVDDIESREELTEAADGQRICQVCIDENEYRYLQDGLYYPAADCAYIDSSEEWEHTDHVTECDDCGEAEHTDNIRSAALHNGNHGEICSSCASNGDYTYPNDSDMLHHNEGLYWSEDAGEYYCDQDNMPCRALQCYSRDVLEAIDHLAYIGREGSTSQFGSKLLFGVELETGSRDNTCALEIAESMMENTSFNNYGICKEDGSISGAELVTLPCDLEAHTYQLDWAAWCDTLRPIAKGYYGNAGIHVHINKAAVSQLTLGKMLVFCNDRNNTDLLSMIAQRNVENSEWCALNSAKFDKVGKSAKDPHNGKYSILNVTRNTIECRMFNSSLLPQRVLKNIEFCHALVKFCTDTSARQLAASYFTSYVSDNARAYPNLSKFIEERLEA